MLSNVHAFLVSLYKHIHTYAYRHKIITAVGIVVSLFLIVSLVKEDVVAETVQASRMTLQEVVSVTGKVEAAKDVSLSFQNGGKVSFVGVSVGDKVSQGDMLATLYTEDEQANLLQARASLENAEATLASLKQGARKEEIAIKEQVVASAQNTLEATYATIPDAIRTIDANTADAIKNKLGGLFIYSGDKYVLSYSSCDQRLQSAVEAGRSTLETVLAEFQAVSLMTTSLSSREAIDIAFEKGYKATVATNELIGSVSMLLLASCNPTSSFLDTYKASLSLARTSMNTTFADISTKRSSLITAKNSIAQAEKELSLLKAGTDPIKVKAQEALVSQAQAVVLQAQAKLSKTTITAPFDGVITDTSLVRGEIAQAGKSVISMISTSAFEVEANIPEIDIAKIAPNNKVGITLDAYGKNVPFEATITRINPSATFEGNVPKYTVVATFIEADERIKTGMTANVGIVTREVQNALALPMRFVTVQSVNKGSVTVYRGKEKVVQNVTLGIRGENGYVEIIDGLLGTEDVLAITPGVRQAQKENN